MNEFDEFKKELEQEIKSKLEEARQIGILIGWNAYAIQAYQNIKDMHSIKEVKAYFKEEQRKTTEKLKMKTPDQYGYSQDA